MTAGTSDVRWLLKDALRASRQGAPVGPPKNLSLVFAIAVGLVSGVGGAFLRELFDRPLESEQPIPRRMG